MPIKLFDPYRNKEKVVMEIVTNDFYRPMYREAFWYQTGGAISFFSTFYEVYIECQNKHPQLLRLSAKELRPVVIRLIEESGPSGGSEEVASLWNKLVLTMKGARRQEERVMTMVYLTYFQKISWYLINSNPAVFRQVKEKIDWEKFLTCKKG